jgi:hypothetical protein
MAQTTANGPLLVLPLPSLPNVILSHFPHSFLFLKYAKDGDSNAPQNSGSVVHGAISQKRTIFIGITVITPNVIKLCGMQRRRWAVSVI